MTYWRSIASIDNHPSNGQRVGGAGISTVFVRLDCGHVRTYPKSKAPTGRYKVRCPECSRQAPRADADRNTTKGA